MPDGEVTQHLDFLICSSFQPVLFSWRSKALLFRGLPKNRRPFFAGKSRLSSKRLLFSGILCCAPFLHPHLPSLVPVSPAHLSVLHYIIQSEQAHFNEALHSTHHLFLPLHLIRPCSSGKRLLSLSRVPGSVPAAGPQQYHFWPSQQLPAVGSPPGGFALTPPTASRCPIFLKLCFVNSLLHPCARRIKSCLLTLFCVPSRCLLDMFLHLQSTFYCLLFTCSPACHIDFHLWVSQLFAFPNSTPYVFNKHLGANLAPGWQRMLPN